MMPSRSDAEIVPSEVPSEMRYWMESAALTRLMSEKMSTMRRFSVSDSVVSSSLILAG